MSAYQSQRFAIGGFLKHPAILLLLGLELFPLYMALQASWKDNAAFIASPWLPSPFSQWQWQNWTSAFQLLLPSLANSIFVAGLTTVVQLTISIGGAYFFARRKMPGANLLWGAFIILMMLPAVLNIVPLFMVLKSLSLLNTLWALILVGIAAGQAFNLYILRNFMEDLPSDLFEAAEIDGASHLSQIRHVVLPLSLPIVGTLSILTFLANWNEFLLPLLVLRDHDLFTIGVRLIYLDGEYVRQWGQLMAAFLLAAVPLFLIFLFTMRWFVKGLSEGAVKG
jgi:ABC-type glycerol-3-phosphate transport system permease component